MTTQTETTHAGDFIISEANGNRSRDNATLISGQDLAAGAVLGKITASGKFTAYDPDLADGGQTAVGVLYEAVDASAGDLPCVVIARDAEINRDQLAYLANNSPPVVEATAEAELAAVGIIVR